MEHRACPACGSDGAGATVAHVPMRTPDGHPLRAGYTVTSCATCATGFADVAADPAYYDRYYADLAKYANEVAVYERATPTAPRDLPPTPDWLEAKTEASADRIEAACPSRDARVLDLGCSTGLVLGALARRGYRALEGIDPSPDSVQLASLRPGVHARVGTFAALPADLGEFDCVVATGVLEHLWDPYAAVAAVCDHLGVDGVVYVEVPDASRYLDPYVAPFEDFSTEHVNHFSSANLRRLAFRAGLETVRESSYLAPLTATSGTGCTAAVWRRGARVVTPERDDALEQTLRRFAARSRRDLEAVSASLERALGRRRELAVWGIGEAAFKLLALEPLASRAAIAYLDGSPARRGLSFDGRRVVAPEELADGEVPIVVTSFLRADAIAAAAERLGVAHRLVRVDGAHVAPSGT